MQPKQSEMQGSGIEKDPQNIQCSPISTKKISETPAKDASLNMNLKTNMTIIILAENH